MATSRVLQASDYFVVVAYFTLMLGIGVYFYRYMKGMKDYFSGGNRIPWWLSGVSFYMSSFSVFAFVAHASLAYKYGWVAVSLLWTSVAGTFFSVVFLSRKWRRARINSPVEYLESRYSALVRQLFAWEGVPVKMIDDALKLMAIGVFTSAALGLNVKQSVLWSGVTILAYTMMGGLWAVAVTDFVQFVVLAVAILILVPLAISRAGGINGLFDGYPEGFLSFVHPPQYDTLYVAGVVLMIILAYSSLNWSLIQRYYCVPTEKDAVKMGWFVVLLFLIGQPLIMLPVICAPKFLIVPPEQTREVYALVCMELLPSGMIGLIIAAMFAATMSMLSSDYNICAGVLTNDIYHRYIRPNASQKELLLVGRGMTLLVGATSLGAAFLMLSMGGEDLFRGMIQLFSIFTAPVALPMILGLLFKRISNKGALAGFLTGMTLGLVLFFMLDDQQEFLRLVWKKETIVIFGTTIVTSVVIVVFSVLFPQTVGERRRAEALFDRLSVPIGQSDEDKSPGGESGVASISPFRVVGISVLLIGVLLFAILPYARGESAFGLSLVMALGLVLIGGLMTLRSGRARKSENSAKAAQE